MSTNKIISEHYRHGNLIKAILDAITRLGKTIDTVTIEDLSAVDEFHIGGRRATEHFLSQLNFSEEDNILDVGCGLGGAARYAAKHFSVSVTGVDVTAEYIETGNTLSNWVKLDSRVNLQQASATSMSFPDASFDGGYMLHVGMNIEDKFQLFSEIYRVMRPGSYFGVYDVMRFSDGELSYPVPWATGNSSSRLETPDHYKKTLLQAGFEITDENNRKNFSLGFFQEIYTSTKMAGGPPALGLHTLMQDSTAEKTRNMITNITAGYIAPVEIIVQKPG